MLAYYFLCFLVDHPARGLLPLKTNFSNLHLNINFHPLTFVDCFFYTFTLYANFAFCYQLLPKVYFI